MIHLSDTLKALLKNLLTTKPEFISCNYTETTFHSVNRFRSTWLLKDLRIFRLLRKGASSSTYRAETTEVTVSAKLLLR